MTDTNDFSLGVIAEFLVKVGNGGKVGKVGKVGRHFEKMPMVLVTHTGARVGLRN